MSDPELQKQHRISKVYLKQFGYKKNEEWFVSVCRKSERITDNILIDKFTAETNIFDLPFADFKLRRHFENTSSIFENYYPTIISNLHNQKKLTLKDQHALCNFVPNILCRSNLFRNFINDLLRSTEKRELLLNEITLLKGDIEQLKDALKPLKIEFHLNMIVGTLMNHMVTVLSNFKQVVIRDNDDNGWLTTDNPVFIDRHHNFQWLLPIESEIYFPLSKDFCLFMYHDKSEIKSNPLRTLIPEKVNSVDFSTFENMTRKIVFNLNEYMIMNTEINSTLS